jgi:hypothetical protein
MAATRATLAAACEPSLRPQCGPVDGGFNSSGRHGRRGGDWGYPYAYDATALTTTTRARTTIS